MRNTLITIAEFHLRLGLIGIDEFNERVDVALWISDGDNSHKDPRNNMSSGSDAIEQREIQPASEESEVTFTPSGCNQDDWMSFLFASTWVFTKSDPDSYPSVPHGHYRNQNKEWPKLNPYTGRAFKEKHQEDKAERLSRKELKQLWSDEKFKTFCREMIVWYQEQYPHFEFHVANPLQLPRCWL